MLITVVDVFRSMGVETDKRKTWAVGAAVANKWVKEMGEEPPKKNRPKTNGKGKHCFAVYPESWRSVIESFIKLESHELEKQQDFFA